jgi:hypothetical protein
MSEVTGTAAEGEGTTEGAGTLADGTAQGTAAATAAQTTDPTSATKGTAANDDAKAAVVRAESFLKTALEKLEQWLHIGGVAEAHAAVSNALNHTAEAKVLADQSVTTVETTTTTK